MDTLRLNGIEVECIIGTLPQEREFEQKIIVNLELEMDMSSAAESDDLLDTVDYVELVDNVREALGEARCHLLERAAEIVANVCLAEPRIERVTATVRKFGAIRGLASAEVTLTRPN